jgi:DNA-binding MarR family transcriptional regulator
MVSWCDIDCKENLASSMPHLSSSPAAGAHADEKTIRGLARFRDWLRRFLRSVGNPEPKHGIPPQQLQPVLGVGGFTGLGRARVSELAEFLQERHHSVVELIDCAEHRGLVRRETASSDRRIIQVFLTRRGRKALAGLVVSQWEQAGRVREPLRGLKRSK